MSAEQAKTTREKAHEQTTLPGAGWEGFIEITDPELRNAKWLPKHGPSRALWFVDVDAYDSAPEAIAAALAAVTRYVCPECGNEQFLPGERGCGCGCVKDELEKVVP